MKKLLFLLILFYPALMQAQSVSPQVVSTAGGYMSDASISLSYTIGELAVQTLTAGSLVITQGFQQPADLGTFREDILETDWQVKTWPNPVANELHLKLGADYQQDILLEIIDISGRVHLTSKLETPSKSEPYKIEVSDLKEGLYLIKIRTADHSMQRMVKILKE